MSPEKVIEIFERNGVTLTEEEADFFTGFLNNISELAIKIDDLRILQKTVLDFAETCSYLNISSSHLYKLTAQKLIPHFCPKDKKLYFKRDELDTWLSVTNSVQRMKLKMKLSIISFVIDENNPQLLTF